MLSPTLITWLLYISTSLIWGSTWIAIQFQLGVVSPLWSVSYRFFFASAILMLCCVIMRLPMRFPWQEHKLFIALGALLFALNYILFYFGSAYFISGLVAVLFAAILPFNILQARVFFATPLTAHVILGSMIGLVGLVFISWAQIKALYLHADTGANHIALGLTLCIVGTWVASCGQMMAALISSRNIPILQSNAWAMLYGATFVTLAAIVSGEPPAFDTSIHYVSSLLYLSIFGTVLAFGTYLSLIKRIGPGRAAYTFLLTPLIAMIISSVHEGFTWDIWVILGTGLILWGNIWVLQKR